MKLKNEKLAIILAGLAIGVIAVLLVLFGNPTNMGFCIACFLRDTAGGLKLHTAAVVQYVRPEIIGLVLGSFLMACLKKEWAPKGGSAPLTRFILGFFVMVGCLAFLGCPFRMILRLAGGDLNALFGLLGFVGGILAGVFFLNKGYSLKRTYKLPAAEGSVLPLIMAVLLVLPTGFEGTLTYRNADRVCALVLSTDESDIHDTGLIRTDDRRCRMRIPGGQFAASLAAMLDKSL